MKRADVKVGFACNNMCSFCVQGDKRSKYKPRTIDEIKNILKTEFENGAESLVFTGGEPTVHPNLIEAIEYARKIGFKQIQIQSNGRNFAKNKVCEGTWKEYSMIYGWDEFIPIK